MCWRRQFNLFCCWTCGVQITHLYIIIKTSSKRKKKRFPKGTFLRCCLYLFCTTAVTVPCQWNEWVSDCVCPSAPSTMHCNVDACQLPFSDLYWVERVDQPELPALVRFFFSSSLSFYLWNAYSIFVQRKILILHLLWWSRLLSNFCMIAINYFEWTLGWFSSYVCNMMQPDAADAYVFLMRSESFTGNC